MEDDLLFLSEQREELMAAASVEKDMELAFQLQFQEAITASLSAVASTSAPPLLPLCETEIGPFSLQHDEIQRLELQLSDRKLAEREMRKNQADLDRRLHDRRFAEEILNVCDEEWYNRGDFIQKPFGEGCSSDPGNVESLIRLYFKGVVSEESEDGVLIGIGVGICDPSNNLVFGVSKRMFDNGTSKTYAEGMALIEGLNAALSLEIRRIKIFCDHQPLFHYITGKWQTKQRKIAVMIDKIDGLLLKFKYCDPVLVTSNQILHAYTFAREAIASKTLNTTRSKNPSETCSVCLESKETTQFFSVPGCGHRYCFSCTRQHIEVQLLHGVLPGCPHEGCKSRICAENCARFLPLELVDKMEQRRREAEIPIGDKVYCPYPKCSALMSRKGVPFANVGDGFGPRRCLKCQGHFCLYCMVPWHQKMTCREFRQRNPNPPLEDVFLKLLASRKLWRQCLKCSQMIELAEGCYHMTCRCGFEFCYNCGAEWKGKKPTCGCPLWAEDRIIFDRA